MVKYDCLSRIPCCLRRGCLFFSYFTKDPPLVPEFANWARIRLDQNQRLIGFLIPQNLHNQRQDDSDYHLDKNTFYTVFLDAEHDFYPL